LRSNLDANETAAEFVRAKIREVVDDADVAELLSPRDHHFAARRLCVADNYYETFNSPHVRLVDISRSGITEITPTGVRVGDSVHDVDTIVFATGFDAFTGALGRIDIVGVDGHTLREAWANGPTSYLGLMIAGFPNMFMITGPGSPSVLSNVVVSIEQHVEFITALLVAARADGASTIDVDPEAQERWCGHVDEVGQSSLLATTRSWYLGSNVEGKPQRFMPYAAGVDVYREICEYVALTGYPGFRLLADAGTESAQHQVQLSGIR
jgi:cyclohexanone monooxygenase